MHRCTKRGSMLSRSKLAKYILYIALPLFLFYAGFTAYLYYNQENFFFFPTEKAPKARYGFKDISLRTEDGLIISAAYKAPEDDTKPVILFFHGNLGDFEDRYPKARHMTEQGYGVLLAEYRGFGGNMGQPSEHGFYKDGRAYYKYLADVQKIPPKRLIVYGESIGSATATYIASENPVRALILEVPFSSMYELSVDRYPMFPIKWIIKHPFRNDEKILNVNAPVLILHGHHDELIPFKYAQKLYQLAKEPKRFVIFKQGTHNTLYSFDAKSYVIDFIKDIMLNNVSKSEEIIVE